MDRAVPSTIRMAPSTSLALRSTILSCAISRTWLRLIFATLFLLGTAEPRSTPTAFLMRTLAGGVFKMKVKLRSA